MKPLLTLAILLVNMLFKNSILIAQISNINIGAIEFIENKGQWNPQVKYQGHINGGEVYLLQNGFKIDMHNKEDLEHMHASFHNKIKNKFNDNIMHSHAYKVSFINSSPLISQTGEKPLNTYNNYFIGNDSAKWSSNCKIFQAVTYKNIYPNIDVRYYTNNKGGLKYDIIIHPGGDINKIAMQYEGINAITLKHNELHIKTTIAENIETLPISYKLDNQTFEKQKVNVRYQLHNNIVTFKVDNYNKNQTLIIDPTLVFSSFAGSANTNLGFTATYGTDGSLYGGGIALEMGFPVSDSAYQTSGAGDWDIAIIKLSSDGSSRIYATYIGGDDVEYPHSLIVDSKNNLIIAGHTQSINYPTTLPNKGPCTDQDIILTKLNTTGTKLINSIKIGGTGQDGINIETNLIGVSKKNSLIQNYADDARSEVVLDAIGNVYLSTSTQSKDFPVTPGCFQDTLGGLQDGAVLKFTPDLDICLFSSYLGGSDDDAAYVLAINPTNNNIYVAGGTKSSNFPGNKIGVLKASYQDSIDGYIAIINNTGTNLIKSTYIGTSGTEQVYGIQFDKNGYPYIMGTTTGNWPHINAKYYDTAAKQFIGKLEPTLFKWVYTTVFGNNSPVPNISPVAFLVDKCENIYVSGWGGHLNANAGNGYTTGLPVTKDAIKDTTDGKDFYFFVLKKNADTILYGSFFGTQNGYGEHVDGGTSRFDKNGVVYQAICSCNDSNFPTTPGAWSTSITAGCNLALVKIAFNLAGVESRIRTAIGGVPRDTIGCLPLTVDFVDTIGNAKQYIWNFGDSKPFGNGTLDTTTTTSKITHTFDKVGTFKVRLVGVNSSACIPTDTAYVSIRVGNKDADIKFNSTRVIPCEDFKMNFQNTSNPKLGPSFSDTAFTWDFGDGSSPLIGVKRDTIITHKYLSPGSYPVKLVLRDTAFCNVFDTITNSILVKSVLKANFQTPSSGCLPYTAIFNNTTVGINPQQYTWDFDDGGTSNQTNPTHSFNISKTYHVKLTVRDTNTCNIIDDTIIDVIVSKPTANFSYLPVEAKVNVPKTFTNNSINGNNYLWLFGDGDSLRTTDKNAFVKHQYRSTTTFNTCLVVTDQYGCTDTKCQPIESIVEFLADVPTAFTPGKFGLNSTLKVDGFGIVKMNLKIFNRWGQKIFETTDKNIGWDGTFKGQLQPVDVYIYTLEAEFINGKKLNKKGDITLIR